MGISSSDVAAIRYRGSQPPEPSSRSGVGCHRLLRSEAAMTAPDPLPAPTQTEMSRALANAGDGIGSRLPQSMQHRLFEAAVAAQGDATRHDLAVYLHHRPPRTCD